LTAVTGIGVRCRLEDQRGFAKSQVIETLIKAVENHPDRPARVGQYIRDAMAY